MEGIRPTRELKENIIPFNDAVKKELQAKGVIKQDPDEERARKLEQMAAQVKLREELRKPARIKHIVETHKMIRQIEQNCLAQSDCALVGMAVLSIRMRRGILGRILRKTITLDEVRHEIDVMHTLREGYVAEAKLRDTEKGKGKPNNA